LREKGGRYEHYRPRINFIVFQQGIKYIDNFEKFYSILAIVMNERKNNLYVNEKGWGLLIFFVNLLL
jgi:hypothetical protein